MTGAQILALAIAVFVGLSIGGLIWREQWRMYVAGSMNLPQSIDDPTEADRSQWPTDEYAKVQTRAERLELEPADHIGGDTLVLVGPGFVHMRCRDARRDGGTPCTECGAEVFDMDQPEDVPS